MIDEMLVSIELELKKQVEKIGAIQEMEGLTEMMTYHLGWSGEDGGGKIQGKRIRPLLVTLCHAATNAKWDISLPAAAAVELIHNFSLIHDDIEDNSPIRRGRPTVWKVWGMPQAVNTGDAMFSLAHLAIYDLEKFTSPSITLKCGRLLQQTCLELTQGQYLDIHYENFKQVSLDSYWRMVSGKTATLLACCCQLGAVIGKAPDKVSNLYRKFGLNLGLAFQTVDDMLGVWGDFVRTGKSVESDLVSGKKSLPILYGLSQKKSFHKKWPEGKVPIEEVPEAVQLLQDEGAKEFSSKQANFYTSQALKALEQTNTDSQAASELKKISSQLLQRLN